MTVPRYYNLSHFELPFYFSDEAEAVKLNRFFIFKRQIQLSLSRIVNESRFSELLLLQRSSSFTSSKSNCREMGEGRRVNQVAGHERG